MNTKETEYNVACIACGAVWTPALQSALWWQAHQHAVKGYLDALHVSGEKCGCVKKEKNPSAPIRVFGYDDGGREFNIPFTSFVAAVKKFHDLSNDFMMTVFIKGVSDRVKNKIKFG